jgi:excisionase family DNA binding protein
MIADADVLLTVREAAQRLAVREGTLRLWLSQRRLPRVNCGRAVRIPSRAIEDFIRYHTVPAKISFAGSGSGPSRFGSV